MPTNGLKLTSHYLKNMNEMERFYEIIKDSGIKSYKKYCELEDFIKELIKKHEQETKTNRHDNL